MVDFFKKLRMFYIRLRIILVSIAIIIGLSIFIYGIIMSMIVEKGDFYSIMLAVPFLAFLLVLLWIGFKFLFSAFR